LVIAYNRRTVKNGDNDANQTSTYPRRCKKIAAAAEAEALANNWAVVIAIVDDGGHLMWLQRLDGVAPISAHIAPAKATTAALGKRESKIYEDIINNGRYSFLSAPLIEGMLEVVFRLWLMDIVWGLLVCLVLSQRKMRKLRKLVSPL